MKSHSDMELRMLFVEYIKKVYADDSGLEIHITGEFCDALVEDEYQKFLTGYMIGYARAKE